MRTITKDLVGPTSSRAHERFVCRRFELAPSVTLLGTRLVLAERIMTFKNLKILFSFFFFLHKKPMSNKIDQHALFPQFESMTEQEKLQKIARHLPCDACECQGWRPFLSVTCACGHEVEQHVDNKKDWTRRFKVALRIEELLEVS